jgi:hypothetical protein
MLHRSPALSCASDMRLNELGFASFVSAMEQADSDLRENSLNFHYARNSSCQSHLTPGMS